MKSNEAKAKLEGLGLNVVIETEESTKPENEVIAQNKSAGTQLNKGETVKIVVAKKKKKEEKEENTNTEVSPETNTETPSETNTITEEETEGKKKYNIDIFKGMN